MPLCAQVERNLFAFNTIRIVNANHPRSLTPAFLDRISNARYNYVAVPFGFYPSNKVYGDGDVFVNLRRDISRALDTIESWNRHNESSLRMIPMIGMSSRWARGWQVLRRWENSGIGINSVVFRDEIKLSVDETERSEGICGYAGHTDMVKKERTNTRGSNSWAHEPRGADSTIYDVLAAVRAGWDSSNVSYPLEFIHLGHDEPQILNWCLIGGVAAPCGTAIPYKGIFARGHVSAADTARIEELRGQGVRMAEVYQTMLAQEIHRRVVQVRGALGPHVRVMIYADSWDDQSWGGVPLRARGADKEEMVTLAGVVDLPGLDGNEKAEVKDGVILILWNYTGRIERRNHVFSFPPKYSTRRAFRRLAGRGFNCMYVGALVKDPYSLLFKTFAESREQMERYAGRSSQFPHHCKGYMAAAWVSSYDTGDPQEQWDIIEYLVRGTANYGNLPKRDFE